MRNRLIALLMLLGAMAPAGAQVSIGVGLPNVSIGINLPVYPNLAVVPGYPVYYAPRLNANYFFYDGFYWVYQGDSWYSSSWYNGPWVAVAPDVVPVYVLRVPVRYYQAPPLYFRAWQIDAAPRWGDHWGGEWAQHHSGWDQWNRASAPAPAPLPVYQRQYSGSRYPRVEQQVTLQSQNYRYQPSDPVVRQQFQAQQAAAPQHAQAARVQSPPNRAEQAQQPQVQAQRTQPPAQRSAQQAAPDRASAPPVTQHVPPQRQAAAPAQHAQPAQQRASEKAPKSEPLTMSGPPAKQERPQQSAAQQHPSSMPAPRGHEAKPQGKAPTQQANRGPGDEKDHGKGG